MSQYQDQGVNDLNKLNYWRRYQSTLSFILSVTTKKLFPTRTLRIEHSMSKGFYCTLGNKLSKTNIKRIERVMKKLISENLAITKKQQPRKTAINICLKHKLHDKVCLLETIRKQQITLYSLAGTYGMYMIPPLSTTGEIKQFALRKLVLVLF